MLKQFNLDRLIFDEPTITTDEEGQTIATTHGDGWYAIHTQADYDGINGSVLNGGEVWEEDGKIHYSGAMPTVYHIFDRSSKKWRLPNQDEREQERKQYLAMLRNAKLDEINSKAQAFVTAAAELDKTPEFERGTWQEQAKEAVAWQADNSTPTPTLDEIAKNRGVPVEILRQKAYEKTIAFRHLTNSISGQRQALEDKLEAAQTEAEIEAIIVTYQLGGGDE